MVIKRIDFSNKTQACIILVSYINNIKFPQVFKNLFWSVASFTSFVKELLAQLLN